MELNGQIQNGGSLVGSFGYDTGDYNLLSNKPQINGVELVGNKTSEDLHITGGGTDDYNDLDNKPMINGVQLSGNLSPEDLGLAEINFPDDPTLYLNGSGEFTEPDYFSGDYDDLSHKPQINGVTLTGNLDTGDLLIDYDDISGRPSINSHILTGNKTTVDLGIDYDDLSSRPEINGHILTGDQSSSDLGLEPAITYPEDPTQYLDGTGAFTTPPTTEVTVTPDLNTGQKIGTIEVDGSTTDLYSGFDPEGTYNDLTVGLAEEALKLSTGSYNQVTDCYIERDIPEDSQIEYQKIIGVTLAWNQLVDTGTTSVTIASGHKYIKYSGGEYTKGSSDGTAVSVSNGDLFFDITQMFGSNVADNLTAEQFAALFPDTSYAYDVGTLESVNVSEHKAYDSNATEVSSIMLDSSKEFRGLYKLVDGELRADGDIYESDGTVTRYYGIIDISTIPESSWSTSVQNNNRRFRTLLNFKTPPNNNTPFSAICNKYITTDANNPYLGNVTDCVCGETLGYICIYDNAYTTVAQFLAASSGVYLVYEIDTPTTETATPYNNPQLVDADGTEKFIDYGVEQGTRDVAIPPGVNSNFYLDDNSENMTIPKPPAEGEYTLKAINGILIWSE